MKNFKLSYQIAKTHLRARLKQTIVATLGVTFGIAVFIYMISFITGSNDFFIDIMMTNSSHVHIYKEIKAKENTLVDKVFSGDEYVNQVTHVKPESSGVNIKDGFEIVKILREDPRVFGVSPTVTSQVFYRYGSANLTGTITGIEPEQEDKLFRLGEKITTGELEGLYTTYNGIIMGKGLAEKLNVETGDRINATTPEGNTLMLQIVAIFRTGLVEIDNSLSYATIKTVQKILGENGNYLTDIKLKLHDLNTADVVAREYEKQFGYKADDWMTVNAAMMANVDLNNIIVYGVVIAILFVAGFGIYNILTMMIYEKMKDIAILKAMGFSGKDVRQIFMTEALVVGLIGGVLGLILGFLLAYAMTFVPFESDIMIEMDHLPVNFKLSYYIAGIAFGLITTTFAGYFPARKAANVDPIAILRG
ncbi:ABC transporter permease [Catalinimonas sp. 4WD22]|uniref:ABC transporter permease n=1 Tax=Catalinimonas locisalis TaxID=3133978 RepID=UPI0031010C43